MAEDAPEAPDRVAGAPHPADATTLFGQDEAEARFLAAWAAGRLHHAWLLRGPRGIGKATLAYRIARALIATPPGGGLFGGGGPPESLDLPEGCPVLARIRAGGEPMLRIVRRSANDKERLRSEITVDDIRKLRSFFQLSAPDGGRRVVIVDAADEMNRNAANALLKSLEEPPADTVMLLVSHEPARLLPTIRSRCRVLDLAPLSAQDFARALAGAGATLPDGEIKALEALAAGSVGRALELAAADGPALYARMIAVPHPNGADRAAIMALGEIAAMRDGAPGLAVLGELTLLFLGRLARYAAGRPPETEAVSGEAALGARFAARPGAAPPLAELSGRAAATLAQARAVNLDPGQTIIDIWLDFERTLGELSEPV